MMLPCRELQNYVLAFDNTNNGDRKFERNSHKKYFLLRVNITDYKVLLNGKTFYDQQINDQIMMKSMMKLERLQQENEMITQQVVY